MRQRDIIAVSVFASLVFVSIMAAVTRFLWTHNKTTTSQDQPDAGTEQQVEQQTSLLSRARSVKLFPVQRREKGYWVPTLSGIIKAGDENVFSSLMLNVNHGTPGELSLQDVYEAFANELRNRPAFERGTYTSEVNKFLSSTRRVQRLHSASMSPPRRPGHPKRTSRKSVDVIRNSIDLAELGIVRSCSTRKSATSLVPLFNAAPAEEGSQGPNHTYWHQDLQRSLSIEEHTAIPITGQEIAALSVILGSPVDIDAQDEKCASWVNAYKGALGISITATATKDGEYHISLSSNKRNISQLPAKGSGYSTLLAKHLTSGSLPFSSDGTAINSIIITNDTLENLKSGTHLHLQHTEAPTNGAKFLASLPNSRNQNFHILAPSLTTNSSSHLIHAISDLVFTGGFTPFASTPLIQTVRFVASGGLIPGRLLQRLDALVEKVHRQAPHLQLFGPLLEDSNAHLRFRANERLGKLVTGTLTDEPLADKTARMSRYTTLLERLMALIPDTKPADVLTAVREATRGEIERAYEDAVAAHLLSETILSSPSSAQSKRNSSQSRRRRSRYSNNSSGTASPDGPASFTSSRASSTFPVQNLGRQVEDVLKGRLPLDVQSVALVARLVLVAWTLSVEGVAWEEGEKGLSIVEGERLPGKMFMW